MFVRLQQHFNCQLFIENKSSNLISDEIELEDFSFIGMQVTHQRKIHVIQSGGGKNPE